MRVLLISANTETINMPVLPLGLACVAEAVQNAGHEIKLVDLMDQQDGQLVLADVISEFQPEIVGISVRNIDDQCMGKTNFLLDSIIAVVNHCRRFTDAPIALGGAGYSIFPESGLEYLGADMGIQGEGEVAFVTLLERLSQKEDISGIPGLYLSGQTIQGEVPERYTDDLDECALPLLCSHQPTLSASLKQKVWVPFQTRLGCPLNCNYCSTASIEGNTIRKHSPAVAVEAISNRCHRHEKR